MDWSLFDKWDFVALFSVAGLLAVGYFVVPIPVVQYAVWLTIFTIWMVWFVYFGTKYYYSVDI